MGSQPVNAVIRGTGAFLPERVVGNEELARLLGVEADWIYKSSGIRNRRWASPGTSTSSLAAKALQSALEAAGLQAGDIDYLLFGTMTPDRFIPGSATSVQNQLGLKEIPCLDIRATCCNLLYALQLAKALISSGTTRNVAVCLAEIQSSWLTLNPDAAAISMLFGDGASALIVSSEPTRASLEILDVLLLSNGAYVDDLGVRCPGTEFGNIFTRVGAEPDHYAPRMAGQSVILQAVKRMTSACRLLIERNAITIDSVRWLVPHQANSNLLAQVARSLKFVRSEGIVTVLEESGNTSSASMGIALDSLCRSGNLAVGELVLLPAFGAGFTWGAGLARVQ